jgi:hypothetical protein
MEEADSRQKVVENTLEYMPGSLGDGLDYQLGTTKKAASY